MTKEEALAKFNRISNDPRQAQAFVKDLLDGKLIEPGTKLYFHALFLSNHTQITVITTGTAKFKSAGGPPYPTTTDKIITVHGDTDKLCSFNEIQVKGVFVYNTETGTFSFTSFQGMGIESDTVTPL